MLYRHITQFLKSEIAGTPLVAIFRIRVPALLKELSRSSLTVRAVAIAEHEQSLLGGALSEPSHLIKSPKLLGPRNVTGLHQASSLQAHRLLRLRRIKVRA